MQTSEVNGVPLLPVGEGSASGAGSLADTFDNFLVLLTTQLQNQDPLSPLDATQFTDQLVQFSSVEQTIKTNDKLDDLIALQGGNQLSAAVSYIGRDIKTEGELISLQDGASTILCGLEGNTAKTTIGIVNEFGQTLRTITGETSAGMHEVVWDGLDDQGIAQPDGVYGVVVTATDGENQPVTAATGTRGRVTGVETQDGEVFLKLGELLVPLAFVFAVDEAEPLDETT
jgi:flagellar basal-body rod modification protein FlgD